MKEQFGHFRQDAEHLHIMTMRGRGLAEMAPWINAFCGIMRI